MRWRGRMPPFLLGSILGYSAYIWLLKVRPTTEVATHDYVNPLIAVFLRVTFAHEKVTWVQIAGQVIILLGVVLVSKRKTRKREVGLPAFIGSIGV